MENMKKINIKQEILNAVKNVKLEGTNNFNTGNFYNAASVDLEISFDIKGRHIRFDKKFEFGCELGLDGDETFEYEMLEKYGYSEEDIEQMPDEEREDFWDGLYFSEYDDWAADFYLPELLDGVFGDDNAELIKFAHEYIEENIEKIYMVKDAGYACNFESDMSALYIFGEFVGYIITDYFDKDDLDVDLEVYDKKYVKVGKIFSENNDKVEYEMYWKGLDLAVSGDNKWIITKYLDEDVYDIKIEENGDIMMADFGVVAA